MTYTHILLSSGKAYAVAMPEKPKINTDCKMIYSDSYPCDGRKSTDYYCKCHELKEQYENEMEQAIANKVEFEDQNEVKIYGETYLYRMPTENHPYPITEGYRIEVSEVCGIDGGELCFGSPDCPCEDDKSPRSKVKVAKLIKS